MLHTPSKFCCNVSLLYTILKKTLGFVQQLFMARTTKEHTPLISHGHTPLISHDPLGEVGLTGRLQLSTARPTDSLRHFSHTTALKIICYYCSAPY